MPPLTTKTASRGKSGNAKNAAQKPTKGGPKKAAPRKRRPVKKKGGRSLSLLLLAFAAGLVVASLAFWALRDISIPSLREIVERDPPAPSPAMQAAGQQRAVRAESRTDGGEKKPILPKVVARPSAQALKAGRDAGRESAVESALTDLQSLAYEEGPVHASLDERIRQVDYALMQAGWLRKLPAASMRLAAVENRVTEGERYRFQRLEILPGGHAAAFVDSLRDCLALWGEGASLQSSGKDRWSIFLGSVHTHSIHLYPGQTQFPSASAGTVLGAPPGEGAMFPGMAMPRLRAGGEEPKLVLVIDDLGASESAVRQLLALDYPVTCAFWPHGAHTRSGALAAHARGREILVHQPMEPVGYPKVKPGPNVLLTGMSESRIRRIVENSIAAVPHAAGLNNHMGSRFTQRADGVNVVIRVLREQGLFMLDSLTHKNSVFASQGRRMGIKRYRRDVFLDTVPSRGKVLEELRRAERIALFTGQAVAIGHPLPETLAALKDWQRLRNKDVRIVKLRDLAQDR